MATSAHRRSSLRQGSSAATDLNNNNRKPEQGTPQRAGQLLSSLAVLPGIGAALLPAVTCPACWPAYAGLLSALGLGFANYTPYLLPLTIVFLTVALGALGYQALQRGGVLHERPCVSRSALTNRGEGPRRRAPVPQEFNGRGGVRLQVCHVTLFGLSSMRAGGGWGEGPVPSC